MDQMGASVYEKAWTEKATYSGEIPVSMSWCIT